MPQTFNHRDSDSYLSGIGVQNVDVGAAPSGYGQQYDNLFAANPYRNLTYNRTGWQALLSALGFRTQYDDYVEQAKINAAEYDAGIFSQIQQNEYNDPASQAQRMRNAGMNPDVLGIGDVDSAAGPTEDPNGMQVSSSPSEFQALSIGANVAGSVLDVIPKALSFATQLSQLKGIRLENDSKELSFGESAIDAASKFFMESITEQDYRDAFEKNDWTNILDAAKKDSQYLGGLLFSSKKAQQRFNYAYGVHARSLQGLISKYGSYDEFEKNRKSLLEQRASHFFSDDDDTMMTLLNDFLGPLGEYQTKIAQIDRDIANMRSPELEQGLRNTQMSNQQLYEDAIDPVAQAEAENEVNKYQAQQNQILQATDELFSSLMESLKKSDNWWSKIAMALIGIARAQLMSGIHMQFGRHQSTTSTPAGDIVNQSSSSNVAF